MTGYSDRLNHAFAFAAKHLAAGAPATGGAAFLAQPSNVAVVLTRYGADHATVVAGVLHHVLEEAPFAQRGDLERKVHDKFGPVVLAIALDALEPRFDEAGRERPWQQVKDDYLAVLANAEPRAIDICVADELHRCGSAVHTVRRLGVEYAQGATRATAAQTMWWYRSMLEVLGQRPDWRRPDMLAELRLLSAELLRAVQQASDDGR